MAWLLRSISLLMIIILAIFTTAASAAIEMEKSSSPALFIFGDSSVDSGNNNYIDTIPGNRANYAPYGQNGFFAKPTGRFSDGRVIVDFIAEYAKLPTIPPFLQPSADYLYGVSFASGGAGVLSETNEDTVVIDLKTQLKHFEEVQKSLTKAIGDVAKVKELISEAVYFFSIGSNDYMGGYLRSPIMQELYPPDQYVGMVIGNLTLAIQELYMKGGRKFAFLSLSPLGCLPVLRARNVGEGCLEKASALASAHNAALNTVLSSFQNVLKGFKYCNPNFYNWLEDVMNNPTNYGFNEGVNACCGTGPYRGLYTCGGVKKVKDYDLCDNADEYVWWDSYHPTERLHEEFAKVLWNGSAAAPLEDVVGSYNLQNLFLLDKEKITIADIVDDPDNEQTHPLKL